MPNRTGHGDCPPSIDAEDPAVIDWYFTPGRGVEMSARMLRRAGLTGWTGKYGTPYGPDCCNYLIYKNEFVLPKAARCCLTGFHVPNAFTGPPKLDADGQPRYPGQRPPWQWFFFSGLVGFPITARLAWTLSEWGDVQFRRFIGLLVNLSLYELGQKFLERFYCIIAVLWITRLIAIRPDTGRPDDDDVEAIAHHPPRGPGVAPFALYVPRC